VFGALKLILLRAKCSLTIIRHKWVARGFPPCFTKSTFISTIPMYYVFNIISLRRSVRQPGSSFAKFIKLTDHVFLLLSKQVLQFTNFPKRKMTPSFSVGLWLSLLSAHSLTLIPFLIIPSDAFGVTSIYLLLNIFNQNLKVSTFHPGSNQLGLYFRYLRGLFPYPGIFYI
jgi:hypothetical protein